MQGPEGFGTEEAPHQQAHKESCHRQRGNQRLPWLGFRASA